MYCQNIIQKGKPKTPSISLTGLGNKPQYVDNAGVECIEDSGQGSPYL